ncbi:DUF2703 domain-containing protein [Candidatus Bathyarchaeota archaeon]|nr:DUF2703 domain-containing protein [Candidatus Bathyarchaeota archaeon]
MRVLKIKWQRFVSDGQTCPRCSSTDKEIEKAISILKQVLAPLEIEVTIEKSELSVTEFSKNPLESNKIWIGDKPLEEWINATVGQSPCCEVCSPHECRTVEVEGKIYETITADLIVKAGIHAALQLLNTEQNKPCCDNKDNKTSCLGKCTEH